MEKKRPMSPAKNTPPRLTVATYNVHGWIGTDGKTDTVRAMSLIRALDADFVALQEVVSHDGRDRPCPFVELAENMGYTVTQGTTMLREDAHYGNALLSRLTPASVTRHSLDCFGREPRGAIEADFCYQAGSIKIIATHLGLKRKERRCQMQQLHEIVSNSNAEITLLLGDLNEWLPWGHIPRKLRDLFGPTSTPRSFPSRTPLFALDRILSRPEACLGEVRAVRRQPARTASDHLPLRAELTLED